MNVTSAGMVLLWCRDPWENARRVERGIRREMATESGVDQDGDGEAAWTSGGVGRE